MRSFHTIRHSLYLAWRRDLLIEDLYTKALGLAFVTIDTASPYHRTAKYTKRGGLLVHFFSHE